MDSPPTPGLTVRRVPLASLVPDPSNPRAHDEPNLTAIEASLRRFGQAEPLVVQAGTGRVIGGHGRLVAMQRLGWTEADVVGLEVDDLTATSLGIALNRTAELAEWDEPVLARLLEQLRVDDALSGVGFHPDEIDELLLALEEDGPRDLADPGPSPPPENPISRRGDMWRLGEHRLLCGDATSANDVTRLMAGEKAALVATDPPFLVDYSGERPGDAGKDWTASYHDVDAGEAYGFYSAVFTNVLAVLDEHAAIYCWHAHKRAGVLQAVWANLGILDHQQIIWVKPAAVFSRTFWRFRHEPCLMGWRQGSPPHHDEGQEHDTVWEVDWEGRARVQTDHPMCKPLELFSRPMRKHTSPGDVVLEPFSGSGSQILAAEQERRVCRALEIEPAFVDVALRRWEEATGQAATLDGDGRTFVEIGDERGAVETAAPAAT